MNFRMRRLLSSIIRLRIAGMLNFFVSLDCPPHGLAKSSDRERRLDSCKRPLRRSLVSRLFRCMRLPSMIQVQLLSLFRPWNRSFAYLSCGTWSLMGTEVDQPVINELAQQLNFTNEGGAYDTYRLLKNIMGLWILQECRSEWERAGMTFSFPELVELAVKQQPFSAFIDPDDPLFLHPGDMPATHCSSIAGIRANMCRSHRVQSFAAFWRV